MAGVDYVVGPPKLKWQVAMLDEVVSVLNNSLVGCKVAASSGGAVYNPTVATVEFSVTPGDTAPGAFVAGTWGNNEIGEYVAYVLTGTGGLALTTPQRVYLWIRITDNTSSPHELFVAMVGGLKVQ